MDRFSDAMMDRRCPFEPFRRYLATWRPGNVQHVSQLLQAEVVYRHRQGREVQATVGWGRKASGQRAMSLGEKLAVPWVLLEDSFIRSVDLGFRDPGFAVVLDDLGIYYDATAPSRLEALIAASCEPARQARGAALVQRWRESRVSKYNMAREHRLPFAPGFTLVVDQTAGDSSIGYGLAKAQTFARMLEAALDEHPESTVLLKVHPDVISGRKSGHFSKLTPGQASRVTVLASNAHPPSLIEPAGTVYTVTSQMGFEALMWGRTVRVFGMPFYAGWGLTTDEMPAPSRRGKRSLDALVHAALVEYSRCIDPETLQRCEVERLLDWMALQRRQRQRLPSQVQVVGFSKWKKPIARAFFAGSELRFTDESRLLQKGRDAGGKNSEPIARAVWGRPAADSAIARATDDAPLLRVEDGFLRSVGLGAHWVQPLSWVIDRTGMYYDATAPSDLETLLQDGDFPVDLLERAHALRTSIVQAGVTKYNVGTKSWRRPADRIRVVLVPGQVECDASIAFGAPAIKTNMALVEAVRRRVPDAYLVYKPHPDVLAKKRRLGRNEHLVLENCDEVVNDVPIDRVLDQVDEVHVLTSLAGFEALLRGKPVVCYGQPFYSGWGLTADIHANPRRTRTLTLDQMVAAALILYPTYVSRFTGAFTTPERAIYELLHWEEVKPPVDAAWLRLYRLAKKIRERCRSILLA